MKENELMIGDWVCTEHDSTPRQIDWIKTGEVGLFWNKVVTPPYLVPIPITPEILEKNGFVYNDLPFVQGWEQYGLTLTVGGNGFHISCGQNVSMIIDSVHQLQHALHLCGIKKEIVL